jgi:hypothetical protein
MVWIVVALMVVPWLAGAWGLALALNLFGAARRETEFFRGRGESYPILEGAETFTHRLAGVLLLLFAVATTWVVATHGML